MQSTLFTIGTALGRARDHGVPVRLLVSGHWIEGRVSDLDGQGVVLTARGTDHHVVRIQDISAVTVQAPDRDDRHAEARSQPATTVADTPADRDSLPVRVLQAASN